MMSTMTKKAVRDLKQHRLRSMFTIITVAAAVAALWMLAVPRSLDNAMEDRRALDRAHHLRLSPENLWYTGEDAEPHAPENEITTAELEGLQALPNVAAVDARPFWQTQLRIGADVQEIWLVGVDDFADQRVNVVGVQNGKAPSAADSDRQALVDSASISTGRLNLTAGDEVEIRAGDAEFYSFAVSGVGGTVGWNSNEDNQAPVLYVPSAMVHRFLRHDGFNSIEVRLTDPTLAAETLADIRGYLDQVAPEATYSRLPEIVEPDGWAGAEQVNRMKPLLYVLAIVATASALILIATTMNTIVRDQSQEVGIMKAVGASSKAVRRTYLRSALILGGSGALIGTIGGLVLSNAMGRYAQEQLLGIDPVWKLDLPIALIGITVGLAATTLAALPAVRRAMRIPVREAFGSHGIDGGSGPTGIDRLVARTTFLPRLTQIGLRNTARRKTRSLATVVQVALGVGTAVAFGAFAVTGLSISRDTLFNEGSDLTVYGQVRLLDEGAGELIASLPEVAAVQPTADALVEFAGDEVPVRGFPADPIYEPKLTSGRWFTPAEVADGELVAVIGAPLAETSNAGIGDMVEISTKAGIVPVEIVGVDENLQQDGVFLWLPITTVLGFEDLPAPPVYWVKTTSPEPDVVDRVAADIVARLNQPGSPVVARARYPYLQAAQQEDQVVAGVIQIFALPIVAVGMIGLVSAMTTNVLERTREIGILRSFGARSRHLRRIFRAEGVALSLAGWLAGIPIGYALAKLIVWLFGRALHATLDLQFPVWLPFTALLGVIVVARLALRPPLRRAVRMQPGMAIRYE
jgi:putative ABC transport system permease protein